LPPDRSWLDSRAEQPWPSFARYYAAAGLARMMITKGVNSFSILGNAGTADGVGQYATLC
jgi:hypothetical protein